MRPKFMQSDAIDLILADFETHEPHYRDNDKAWFDEYLAQVGGLVESRFEFPDFFLDVGDGGSSEANYSATDYRNIKTLYGTMRTLPESVAIDQRLWIGLEHTDFWDYTQFRNAKRLQNAKKPDDVKGAYFWINGTKRSAHINCLSRLWWAGHLTYDDANPSDPYWLTEVLARESFASRLVLFSSSNFTGNKDIALGILEAIKADRDNGVPVRREHFVGANKYLNQMGSMTVLDCLTRSDVKSLISRYFATDAFKNFKLGR